MLEMAEFMSQEEVDNLFAEDTELEEQEEKETPEAKETPKEKKDTPAEEQVDPENLFDDETPESVGREENNKDKEGADSKRSTSPIFSSLAKTLQEEGILLDLEPEDIDKIKDVTGLKDAVVKWAKGSLDDIQKRVNEALENGMDKDTVKQFESAIKTYNSITPEALKEEGARGENLRKSIIYRDYITKGFSEERARREVERSVTNGTDIEDAEEALNALKEDVQAKYDSARAEAKKEADDYAKEQQRQAQELKESILKGEGLAGLEINKSMRQKILDNIVRPVYKDPETGETYTAVEKFEKDHPVEFLKLVSTFLTLTDWGANLNGIVKGKVRKEVSKATEELERAINSSQLNSDGSLQYASGVAKDSYFSDFTLDV